MEPSLAAHLVPDAVSATNATAQPPVSHDTSHSLEADVRRDLLSRKDWEFSQLVVRRMPNGVCLEGVLVTQADPADVSSRAMQIAGVKEVLNKLVVCPKTSRKPR